MILPLTATWLAFGCGKGDDNCPGLCPDETLMPTMTIRAADGAASIASAKVVGGPCTAMLLRSAGEVGVPTSYSEIQVTYDGPREISPLCIVEVTSRWGQVEAIAPQVKSRAYTQTCCPYGTCCPKTEDALTQRYHLEFDPKTQTISFPPPPDGGAGDDAADAGDAPANADLLDRDASDVDVGTIDSLSVDVQELDASAVDEADEMDLAIDS